MNTYKVKFPATSMTAPITVTVLANTPAEADQKALKEIRVRNSLPAGWSALSSVTPCRIEVGAKFNEVVR